MKLDDLTQTLDLLRAKGVRRAAFKAGAVVEVEFFGADAPPTAEAGSGGGETDFERELRERTEGYERALTQIQGRRFVGKGGES